MRADSAVITVSQNAFTVTGSSVNSHRRPAKFNTCVAVATRIPRNFVVTGRQVCRPTVDSA